MTATISDMKTSLVGQQRLGDEQFITMFENLTLSPDYFDHLGHLRITWLYLQRFDLELVVTRVCQGIKAYATHLGAANKFHLTLTDAMVRVMFMRINSSPHGEAVNGWQQFVENNKDLLDDALGVIQNYYSQQLLDSKLAKLTLVAPDLKPLTA